MENEMEEKIDKAIEIAKGIIQSRTQKEDVQKVAQSILNLAHVRAMHASCNRVSTVLDEEMTFVLGLARTNLNGSELMQVTQAALHLAHAKQLLFTEAKTTKKQGASSS